jgi:FAD/FMN-containing dehydrogenase
VAQRSSPARRAKRARIAQFAADPKTALFAELEAAIVGKVVLFGDPGYDAARQESNPAFQEFPVAIVYCAVENDIAECLSIARDNAVPIAVRSGGHSTAGYSVCNLGLVIDMSLFNHVLVDSTANTVRVGPGADFDKLNGALNSTGLHVPSGACGNVCVGGFVQGGGYGYTSRMFGIQCDSVLAFRVMLADGSVVVAEPDGPHALLHWALRGGTGNNFGVVLEVTYQLYPVSTVWAWSIQWNAADAPAVLVELQANYMRSGAAPNLGMMVNLGFNAGAQVLLAQGMWVGSRADGLAAVQSLMNFPSAQLLVDKSGPYGAMDVYLDTEPYPIPNPPDGSKEDKRAGYIDSPLTLADWQAIVAYAATAPNPNDTLIIEPYGGAIANVPVLASAFVHRNDDMDVFVDVFWLADADRAAAVAWLDGFMKLLAPYLNGRVYQNYPHRDLANYADAYWGPALPKLRQAKLQYDPLNLFAFAQSVPLPGA